jgi:hypothetical protein
MTNNFSTPFMIMMAILIGVPLLFLVFGFKSIKFSSGKMLTGIGTAILLAYLFVIIGYVVLVGPGRSGILAQGTSPQGLEYCVVQTYKGMIEPYQVSFYIRDTNGLWRWNYLAHQDFSWRSVKVSFKDNSPEIYESSEYMRSVPLPTNSINLATVLPGYRDEYCPSNFTIEDVLKYHNEKFK